MNTNLAEKVVDMDGKPLNVINGKKVEQKLTKDGRLKQTPNNSKKNRDYILPFKEEDITKMIDWLDMRIMCAADGDNKEIAVRNKYLFIMGCNCGLRISDLCSLTWIDVINPNGTLRTSKRLTPQKTSNRKKHITQAYNQAFWYAIMNYKKENKISVNIDSIKVADRLEKDIEVKERTIESMRNSMKNYDKYTEADIHIVENEIEIATKELNDIKQKMYLFPSREGEHIQDGIIRKLIKDGAKACGITYPVSTHSMRKSFCRIRYDHADNKTQALAYIRKMLGHSSDSVTLTYIGIMQEEIEDFVNEMSIGVDISEEDKEMMENFRV